MFRTFPQILSCCWFLKLVSPPPSPPPGHVNQRAGQRRPVGSSRCEPGWRRRAIQQHQERSFPRSVQPAGERAPPDRWAGTQDMCLWLLLLFIWISLICLFVFLSRLFICICLFASQWLKWTSNEKYKCLYTRMTLKSKYIESKSTGNALIPTRSSLTLLHVVMFDSLCVSVWERLALLPHQQRQEVAHWLHPQRIPLRHREVSPSLPVYIDYCSRTMFSDRTQMRRETEILKVLRWSWGHSIYRRSEIIVKFLQTLLSVHCI